MFVVLLYRPWRGGLLFPGTWELMCHQCRLHSPKPMGLPFWWCFLPPGLFSRTWVKVTKFASWARGHWPGDKFECSGGFSAKSLVGASSWKFTWRSWSPERMECRVEASTFLLMPLIPTDMSLRKSGDNADHGPPRHLLLWAGRAQCSLVQGVRYWGLSQCLCFGILGTCGENRVKCEPVLPSGLYKQLVVLLPRSFKFAFGGVFLVRRPEERL